MSQKIHAHHVANDVKRQAKRFSLRLLIEIALFILSLTIFVFIVREVVLNNKQSLDNWGWQLVDPIRSPGMTAFMRVFTWLGSWYFLLPAYLILIGYLFIFRKRRSLSMDIFAIAVTSTIVMFALKAIFQRERPLEPLLGAVPGFSFPSGHSFSSFTFFGLLVYLIIDMRRFSVLVKWLLGSLCLLIAAIIALSRVYLKVHYPSDVIAGFFLCVIWLGISFWVLHMVRGKRFLEK